MTTAHFEIRDGRLLFGFLMCLILRVEGNVPELARSLLVSSLNSSRSRSNASEDGSSAGSRVGWTGEYIIMQSSSS